MGQSVSLVSDNFESKFIIAGSLTERCRQSAQIEFWS